jgi:predicted nucleic acid-binding protein
MSVTYVVDASVVIPHFLAEQYTPHARVLFARLKQNDQLCVPEFCIVECANVFWKRARFDGMSLDLARRLVIDLIALPLTLMPVGGLPSRALEIGLAHPLPVYDSIYIALAESLNCPLITVDQRQSAAAMAAGVTLKPITDFAHSAP